MSIMYARFKTSQMNKPAKYAVKRSKPAFLAHIQQPLDLITLPSRLH